MNFKKILFFILSVFCLNAFSQQVEFNIDSANLALQSKNYQLAEKLLKKKIFQDPLNYKNNNYHNLICCFMRNGKPDSAFAWLEHISKNGYSDPRILGDVDLFPIQNDDRWKNVQLHLSINFSKKNPQLKNWELAFDLIFMEARDQSVRFTNNDSLWKVIDSQNQITLSAILDLYGYPKKREVGEASRVPALVLIHAPLSLKKKYFKLVQTAAEQGDISKELLATLTDKMLMNEGKKQLYGTQTWENPETKEFEFYPIEDISNLEKRRTEIGFTLNLEGYAKLMGVKKIPIQD